MKKLITLIILFFFFCFQAQKEKIFIPKVDSTFEKFDFEKDIEKYKIQILTYSKEEKGKDLFLEKKENDKSLLTNYRVRGNGNIEDLKQEIYYNNSLLMVLKIFYPNGNIQRKGLLFSKGAAVGTWYFYEEKGKLSKIENIDKEYLFSYQKVIDYCIKNKIPLKIGYEDKDNLEKAKINKDTLDGKSIWIIEWEYLKKIPRGMQDGIMREAHYQRRFVTVKLDGKTGKLISRNDIHTWYIY